MNFLGPETTGGVGSSMRRGSGRKVRALPRKFACLPWDSKGGVWDVQGILPGCPRPSGLSPPLQTERSTTTRLSSFFLSLSVLLLFLSSLPALISSLRLFLSLASLLYAGETLLITLQNNLLAANNLACSQALWNGRFSGFQRGYGGGESQDPRPQQCRNTKKKLADIHLVKFTRMALKVLESLDLLRKDYKYNL